MLNLYKYYDNPDVLVQRGTTVFIEDVIKKTKDIISFYTDRNQIDDSRFPDIYIEGVTELSPVLFTMRVSSQKARRSRVIVFSDNNHHILVSGADMNLKSVTDHAFEDGIAYDDLEDIVYEILDSLVGR